MKKTYAIAAALICAAFIFVLSSGCGIKLITQKTEISGEYMIEGTVERLKLDHGFGEAVIKYGDTPSVVWDYNVYGVSRDMSVELTDGTLSITTPIGINGFAESKGHVTICLPNGNVEDMDIDTFSGDIEFVGEYTLDVFDVTVTSGQLTFERLNADEFRVDLISGEVTLDRLECENAKMSIVSGEIAVRSGAMSSFNAEIISGDMSLKLDEDSIVDEADILLVSGECSIESMLKQVDVEVTSGDLVIESGIMPNSADLSTTSGMITLKIPEAEDGFTLNYSKGSGSVLSDFELHGSMSKDSGSVSFGMGKNEYNADTVSGTIRIIKI